MSHRIFEKIISLENLFLAWWEFKKGKSSKEDVQMFEFHLEDNLFELRQELEDKTYNHSIYTPFYITDPKLRHIHKASVRDRVLHHSVFRILYPIFDKSFIHHSYSCRIDKGTHKAVSDLESRVRKLSKNYTKNVFALKCDISKYYDSIDQERLMGLINAKVDDQDTLWLIERIIQSFSKQPRKGIPLGNVTSQLFANVYLNELDQFVKHKLKIKHYFRYCDDFIILHESQDYLRQVMPFIQLFLEKHLLLTLHPRKIILTKLSAGIDFLGYVILPHHRILRTRTKRRMLKKIKTKVADYNNQKLDDVGLNQSVQSYLGMLRHCDSQKLKVLVDGLIHK